MDRANTFWFSAASVAKECLYRERYDPGDWDQVVIAGDRDTDFLVGWYVTIA